MLKCIKCGFISRDRGVICSEVQGGCGYTHNFLEWLFILKPIRGIILTLFIVFGTFMVLTL